MESSPQGKKNKSPKRPNLTHSQPLYDVQRNLNKSTNAITFGKLLEVAPRVRQSLKKSLKLESRDDLEEGEIPARETLEVDPGAQGLVTSAIVSGHLLKQ